MIGQLRITGLALPALWLTGIVTASAAEPEDASAEVFSSRRMTQPAGPPNLVVVPQGSAPVQKQTPAPAPEEQRTPPRPLRDPISFRVITPWTGDLAPIYPGSGGSGNLYSPYFPDYHDQAPPRTPPASISQSRPGPALPAGSRSTAAPPPVLPTPLQPVGFNRPWFTAENDPLLYQYGAGVRAFTPPFAGASWPGW